MILDYLLAVYRAHHRFWFHKTLRGRSVANGYEILSAHPGNIKLYFRIRKPYDLSSLPVDCGTKMYLFPHSTRNRIRLRRKPGVLNCFPLNTPFESLFIDIFGELIRTLHDNL